MKNEINESNKYECIKCETGKTKTHGTLCSCNKNKEYQVTYKFSDVIKTVMAGSLSEAQRIADNSKPIKETYCYDAEAELLK